MEQFLRKISMELWQKYYNKKYLNSEILQGLEAFIPFLNLSNIIIELISKVFFKANVSTGKYRIFIHLLYFLSQKMGYKD